MGSTEKLVAALEEAGAPAALVERARRNEFHDFKSESPTPISDLVNACREAGLQGGLRNVVARAIGGEFDATKEESDEWARSPEGQDTFGRLIG